MPTDDGDETIHQHRFATKYMIIRYRNFVNFSKFDKFSSRFFKIWITNPSNLWDDGMDEWKLNPVARERTTDAFVRVVSVRHDEMT